MSHNAVSPAEAVYSQQINRLNPNSIRSQTFSLHKYVFIELPPDSESISGRWTSFRERVARYTKINKSGGRLVLESV
jgi:hypothetical protein